MSRNFRQLTDEDRVAIAALLRAGQNKEAISKQLGFHRSTIYREVARNNSRLGYLPLIARLRINARRKRGFKLQKDKGLRNYIFAKLKLSWSPEQIAGRLKRENKGKSVICHETIYAYLYSDYGIRNKYYQFLRRKRKHRYPKVSRQRHLSIPNRMSIHERPAEINERLAVRHWEGDLMLFSKHTPINLITLRERHSRYMMALKNPNSKAESTADRIIKAFKNLKNHQIYSLTLDNGVEFFKHENIVHALQLQTYFYDPYKSYQKGSIENGNKQLREWLPRNVNIGNSCGFATQQILPIFRSLN